MRFAPRSLWLLALSLPVAALACGAASSSKVDSHGGGGSGGAAGSGGLGGLGGGSGGGGDVCGACLGSTYTTCDANGKVSSTPCPQSCTPGQGCTACSPEGTICVGNEIHDCTGDGTVGGVKETCDATKGDVCSNGQCQNGCALSASEPSNVGCEFYAVDLDLSDGVSNPAGGPWGVVIANAGTNTANVTIEENDAPLGQPVHVSTVHTATIQAGSLDEYTMPVRIVDCAATPGDWNSPGSCRSSNAFRITSDSPIVVYQFNNLAHGYSTDASLLLPTTSLGTKYRVAGWPVAHSFPSPGAFVQRSYITVVGTQDGTSVTVTPAWRVKGNGSVPATAAGVPFTMTVGPFDVLNLESDDATLQECLATKPPYCADMTGSTVEASAPVIVFSGTEESGVGLPADAPPMPQQVNGCCNQHLEEQLFPMESLGKKFLITRSPIRSDTSNTTWVEPDVIRFVGAAATAQVATTLAPPYDSFTLAPGQVLDAWTQADFVVNASEPIMVAQLLVSGDYALPNPKGDPSFTIFPPIEQARTEYVFLSPSGWAENWVVIGTEHNVDVTVDGSPPSCQVTPAGAIEGVAYESRRCLLATGAHRMSGTGAFQIMAYGYADADAYAFAGGADIKKIYVPPPLH